MFCKYCGQQVADEASFCEYCGGDLREPVPEKEPVKPPEMATGNREVVLEKLPYGTSALPPKKRGRLSPLAIAAAVVIVLGIAAPLVKNFFTADKPVTPESILQVQVQKAEPEKAAPAETGKKEAQEAEKDAPAVSALPNSAELMQLAEQAEASSFSTTELPSPAEFDYFYNDQLISGVPDEAVTVTAAEQLQGGWKASFFVDPNGQGEKWFLNIAVEINGNEAVAKAEWGAVVDSAGNEEDLSGGIPMEFAGTYSPEAGLDVADDIGNRIAIPRFYTWNGKQYGRGSYWRYDGSTGFAEMMRP